MSAHTIDDNLSRPFQLEQSALRGRVIRLGSTIDTVLTRHLYPEPVSQLLGEMFVLAATLAAGLKFNGTFSLQTRSDGPISLMVADCTHDGAMRGYAKFDTAAVKTASSTSLPALLGKGQFAVTVDQDHLSTAYQGLVELEGDTLTDCIHRYFRQSEQIKTGMKLSVQKVEGDKSTSWRAGAVMVQSLPDQEIEESQDDVTENWRRTMMLLETATAKELVDPDLDPDRLLLRLFHEEGVRVFDPQPLEFRCRCSRKRVANLLLQFPSDDIDEMKQENGYLAVTCEFCNENYDFTENEVRDLRQDPHH